MTKLAMATTWAIVIFLVAVACSPAAAPPQPTPAPAAPTPAPVSRPAPTPAPQDAAWQKVIDAAKQEGNLIIYASSSFGGPATQAMSEAFGSKYGVKVEIMVSSGRANVERVTIEQKMKAPVADIMQAGLSSLVRVAQDGFVTDVSRELPVLRDKTAFLFDPVHSPDGKIISFQTFTLPPLINTNLVKPQDEPRSYNDLLAPKWKGKIIVEDPRGGGGSGFAWWAGMRYYKVLDDEYWRKLGKQMVFFGGAARPAYQLVGRGEYAMAASASSTVVASMVAEGAPLKQIEMEEGTFTQSENIGVLANAMHPNAAKLFINWLISQEGMTVFAKASSVAPIRKDVQDFSLPGVVGKPKKMIFREWKATEEIDKYQKERLADKLFGEK